MLRNICEFSYLRLHISLPIYIYFYLYLFILLRANIDSYRDISYRYDISNNTGISTSFKDLRGGRLLSKIACWKAAFLSKN